MKLLHKYNSLNRAEKRARYLESKGVKIFISSKLSYEFGGVKTGVFYVGLWVVHNRQYNDAIACFKSRKHRVVNTLSKSEMKQTIANEKNSKQSSLIIIKGGLKIIFLLVLLAYLMYITMKF